MAGIKFLNWLKTQNIETQEIVTTGEHPFSAEDTIWRDIYGRVVSKHLDTTSGHWDFLDGYFRADNTQNLSNNSHALYVSVQLNHFVDYRPGAYTSLHIHWLQQTNPTTANPVWKVFYILKRKTHPSLVWVGYKLY